MTANEKSFGFSWMISLFILNDSFDKIVFAFHLWCAKKQLTNLGDEVHIHPPPTAESAKWSSHFYLLLFLIDLIWFDRSKVILWIPPLDFPTEEHFLHVAIYDFKRHFVLLIPGYLYFKHLQAVVYNVSLKQTTTSHLCSSIYFCPSAATTPGVSSPHVHFRADELELIRESQSQAFHSDPHDLFLFFQPPQPPPRRYVWPAYTRERQREMGENTEHTCSSVEEPARFTSVSILVFAFNSVPENMEPPNVKWVVFKW